jgi:hypothetical protein
MVLCPCFFGPIGFLQHRYFRLVPKGYHCPYPGKNSLLLSHRERSDPCSLVAVPQGKPNGYVDSFTAVEKRRATSNEQWATRRRARGDERWAMRRKKSDEQRVMSDEKKEKQWAMSDECGVMSDEWEEENNEQKAVSRG